MVITTGLLLLMGVYGVVSYNNFHLYASMPSPHALTISGSADGTDAVHLGICPVRYCGRSGMTSGKVAVVEGRWSETFEAGMIEPGSYKVSLSKWADGTSLATSTITVQP